MLQSRRSLIGIGIGASLVARFAYAQSAWNPGAIDMRIVNGFLNNAGGLYGLIKSGDVVPGGQWVYTPNMYIGLVQQLRDAGLDSLSDQVFNNPQMIGDGDMSIPANVLISRSYPYPAQIQSDLQNLINQSIGQETASYRAIISRGGYDDLHDGLAGCFLSFADGGPASSQPIPRRPRPLALLSLGANDLFDDPCAVDPLYCENPPLDMPDPYWPSTAIPLNPPNPVPILPWFDPGNPKAPRPKTGLTKSDFCWYTGWGLQYLGVVLRVLSLKGTLVTVLGGVVTTTAPEVLASISVTLLLAGLALNAICK